MKRHPWATVSILSFLASFVCFSLVGNQDNGGGMGWTYAGLAFSFIAALIPCCCFAHRAAQATIAAATPMPTPPEIELALWKEWGRQPTVEEVAAVHQMLLTQKHHDILMAAAYVGVGITGARAIQGKPLL